MSSSSSNQKSVTENNSNSNANDIAPVAAAGGSAHAGGDAPLVPVLEHGIDVADRYETGRSLIP